MKHKIRINKIAEINNLKFKSKSLNFEKSISFEISNELENHFWVLEVKGISPVDIVKKAHKFNLCLALDLDILWHFEDRYMAEIAEVAELLRDIQEYREAFNELNKLHVNTKVKNMSNEYKAMLFHLD